VPPAPFEFSPSLMSLLLQHLSRDSVNVLTLPAQVKWAWEIATAAEATRVMVVLAAETSAQEAIVAQDNVVILVQDAEDRASLAERVSRVEAESVIMLASAHKKVEGIARKIALLEGELAEMRRA
jgi:hypothetical protein